MEIYIPDDRYWIFNYRDNQRGLHAIRHCRLHGDSVYRTNSQLYKLEKETTINRVQKQRNIGIFSGSFNPIHIGHLALANWLCEFEGLNEIWFLITPHNPLKERKELMDDQFRYELVKASIGSYSKFKASDFEFTLPQPTYTIHTLQALKAKYPDQNFHFIMGADNWMLIEHWKEYESLISNYPILIYPRKGYEVQISANHPNIRFVEAPLMEISSTFIRQSLKDGKDVRFFLPEAIRNCRFY